MHLQARTCRQLQAILEHQDAQPVLQQLYEAYLLQRLEGRKRTLPPYLLC